MDNEELLKINETKLEPQEQVELVISTEGTGPIEETKKETKKYTDVVQIIDDLKKNPVEVIKDIGDKIDWDKFKPVTESQFDKIVRFTSEKLILLLATLVAFFRKFFSSNLFMTVSIMVIQISLFCVSVVDTKVCWIYSTIFASTGIIACALLYNVYKTDKESEKYSEIQNTTLKYLRNKFSKVKE